MRNAIYLIKCCNIDRKSRGVSWEYKAFILLAFTVASAAWSEMRIWSDKKGNTVEAEYVQIIGSKVVLKTREGKTLKVPASGLSAADKKYLADNIPPEISIEVDVDKDRDTLESYSSEYGTYGYERKAESVACNVEIKQTNREECNRSFNARIYVIGENQATKRSRILDISEQTFDFKSSKIYSFNSEPVTMEYSDSSHFGKDGYRYAGYLVCILDEKDKIVKIEASKTSYESNVVKIQSAKEGNTLDNNFNVVKQISNRRYY